MTPQTLPVLHQLPLDEFTLPNYTDGSIANVPATIAALLGTPFSGLPALPPAVFTPLGEDVRRVVLLVIDAWGANYLSLMAEDMAAVEAYTAVSHQLTSIFPSTTVAALSSFWTGGAPAQHGMMGLNIFFPQMAAGGQMIHISPVFAKFGTYADQLVEAGLDVENFLDFPGFAAQLEAAGVETHAVKGREIVDSALSRMHGRGLTGNHGAVSFADMLVQTRELLAADPQKRMFISTYWPSVDSMSHRYGWNHPRTLAELRALFAQIRVEWLEGMPAAARQGTALLITADHGQVICPPQQRVVFSDHPQLQEMLFMRPLGEPRVVYLYAKHGRTDAIISYVQEHLAHAMVPLRSSEALAAGLFGPLPHAAAAAERAGDVVLIMREGYVFLLPEAVEHANKMPGRHGGMTHAEMQVPLWGFRLDA